MKIRLLRTLCEMHNEPVTPPDDYDDGYGCPGCAVGADPVPGCEPTERVSACCGAEVAYGVRSPYCVGCGSTHKETNLTLWFANTFTGVTYPIEFESDDAGDQLSLWDGADLRAVAYITKHGATHAVWEDLLTDPFDPERFPLTYDRLNPLCDHGLSLWLCENPFNHYPTDEQLRGGW